MKQNTNLHLTYLNECLTQLGLDIYLQQALEKAGPFKGDILAGKFFDATRLMHAPRLDGKATFMFFTEHDSKEFHFDKQQLGSLLSIIHRQSSNIRVLEVSTKKEDFYIDLSRDLSSVNIIHYYNDEVYGPKAKIDVFNISELNTNSPKITRKQTTKIPGPDPDMILWTKSGYNTDFHYRQRLSEVQRVKLSNPVKIDDLYRAITYRPRQTRQEDNERN